MSIGGFQPGTFADPYFWTEDVNANCHKLLQLREITGCEGKLGIRADVDFHCHGIENVEYITGCNGFFDIYSDVQLHGRLNISCRDIVEIGALSGCNGIIYIDANVDVLRDMRVRGALYFGSDYLPNMESSGDSLYVRAAVFFLLG